MHSFHSHPRTWAAPDGGQGSKMLVEFSEAAWLSCSPWILVLPNKAGDWSNGVVCPTWVTQTITPAATHSPDPRPGTHHPLPLCLQGELLSPCRCDGSVKCTHQPCLIKWISERGCWSCELCYYKYHVIAISTKNPLQVRPGWDGAFPLESRATWRKGTRWARWA